MKRLAKLVGLSVLIFVGLVLWMGAVARHAVDQPSPTVGSQPSPTVGISTAAPASVLQTAKAAPKPQPDLSHTHVGPDGFRYCDSGYESTGSACVKSAALAVAKQEPVPNAPSYATGPRIEYGPPPANNGATSGYHSYSGSYVGSAEEARDREQALLEKEHADHERRMDRIEQLLQPHGCSDGPGGRVCW